MPMVAEWKRFGVEFWHWTLVHSSFANLLFFFNIFRMQDLNATFLFHSTTGVGVN
jgi:hypothetical protein